MSEKKGKTMICRHCGGALIDRVDDITCIMCGRQEGHVCERCQFMDEPDKTRDRKHRARAA